MSSRRAAEQDKRISRTLAVNDYAPVNRIAARERDFESLGRHGLGADSFDQFGDGGLRLTLGNDADVEAVSAVLMERLLDCGDDPVVAVAEDASA